MSFRSMDQRNRLFNITNRVHIIRFLKFFQGLLIFCTISVFRPTFNQLPELISRLCVGFKILRAIFILHEICLCLSSCSIG